MSTAIYLKLTSGDYFKHFTQAMTYVRAASHTSNGFQLIYRILELVHPRLRQAKGGIHKNIPVPAYSDVTDDSIYTFITKYQNYLLYEYLSPKKREYNATEQTMFIISALRHDTRLRPGLNYAESVLQAYQRDSLLNPDTPFPLELQIDEVGVTLDEHSDEYTVGDKATAVKSTYSSDTRPVIHAFKSRPRQYDERKRKPFKPDYDAKKPMRDNTKTCRACLSLGHCVTSGDICYPLTKATLCQSFLSNTDNDETSKRNLRDYKKERRDRASKSKTSRKMHGVIRKMVTDGATEEALQPIIRLAYAMDDTSDDEEHDYDSDDSSSSQE